MPGHGHGSGRSGTLNMSEEQYKDFFDTVKTAREAGKAFYELDKHLGEESVRIQQEIDQLRADLDLQIEMDLLAASK